MQPQMYQPWHVKALDAPETSGSVMAAANAHALLFGKAG